MYCPVLNVYCGSFALTIFECCLLFELYPVIERLIYSTERVGSGQQVQFSGKRTQVCGDGGPQDCHTHIHQLHHQLYRGHRGAQSPQERVCWYGENLTLNKTFSLIQ